MHERPHHGDAMPAERVRLRLGLLPAAAVRDGQPEPGGGGLGSQPDLPDRALPVAVLDGVRARLADRDQDILDRPAGQPAPAQPGPQRRAGRRELPFVRGKRQVQPRGMAVEDQGDVVFVAIRAGPSPASPGWRVPPPWPPGPPGPRLPPGRSRRRAGGGGVPPARRCTAARLTGRAASSSPRAGPPRSGPRAGTTGLPQASRPGRPGGPGCPAGARRCCRSAGPASWSRMPQKTVLQNAPGTSAAKRSMADRVCAGLASCSSRARQALRSWPITVAASRPWPTQSPTTMPIRPSGSSTRSYQSPPTSSGRLAGS